MPDFFITYLVGELNELAASICTYKIAYDMQQANQIIRKALPESLRFEGQQSSLQELPKAHRFHLLKRSVFGEQASRVQSHRRYLLIQQQR